MINLDQRITLNFTLRELIKSDTAVRHGIDNTQGIDETILTNLKNLCTVVLEPLRAYYKLPLRINSAYRCLELNRLLKSSDNSDHRFGCAADVEIVGVTTMDLATYVYHNLPFHQCILEYYDPDEGPSSGWTHIAHRIALPNRHEGLIINSKGKTIWIPV